ncbi:Uncharacterised protein [uncultured archaeon]|nr:Uncharacterised protein [uncultured archaeon]
MKMSIKKTTDNAVVGVITAILLIGLIVAIISLIQTMYIPKIMEQREADHMDKVAEQFTDLTAVIDTQAANPTNTMPIATSITLGSKELPYMLSTRAYGTLEILDKASSITIIGNPSHLPFKIGRITYSSMNAYFLNQNYSYEAGALIVSQLEEGNLMMIRPSFSAAINSSTLDIFFDVVNITSIGEKTIASGFGTYPIQTEFYNTTNFTFADVTSMTITTPFSNAWYFFIRSSFIGAGINENDFHLPPPIGQDLVLDGFSSSDFSSVRVILKIINIRAQIGPGWVQQNH